ncbi:glutathione peroxidase [Leucobacter soli]|uniref:Hydroperoxy fatty acid reductase gpx1 n=1 Tax=Leucobacter soli TaxID=2812850 RepID=A0A916JWA6_9MICO|nr:glutathione peroxidase [Leucobacter soli]CAG7606539.1 Hydroperoxy fatty acid reductase gpx1 [Leucobacter soli]
MSALREIEVVMPGGETRRFGELAPGAALVVNVASKCGFTPQYAGLEELHREFGPQGLAVIGMPCNQFLKQEPGTDGEIAEFCSVNYGVTFPLLAKGKVNGRRVEPLYRELRRAKDPGGSAGVVRWNFEKFVVGRDPAGDGRPSIVRFRSVVEPDDPALRAAIEAVLPA